jgi:hypothetical protein
MKVSSTITYPDSLNEITLGQYQHYLKVSEGLEGDYLAQRTVSILCDIRLSDIMMMKLSDVREISEHLNLLFSMDQELQTTFKIKEQKFGFIPSLEDISFGEYVDLDKYITDWATMHQAMAVLYRPVTKSLKDKYTITEYEGTQEYADLMRFMPLDVALGALVFFYQLGNELLKSTRNYLLNQMEELTTASNTNSTSNGDGTTVSTPSLMETLEHLTTLPSFELPQHLHI